MALVHHKQEVFREEVEQAVGAFAGLPPIEVARIVFDTRAVPQFLDHLHVILHTFLNALCLNGVTYLVEVVHLLHKVVLDHAYGLLRLFFGSDEEVGRIEFIVLKRLHAVEGLCIHFLNGIDFIVPPRDAQHVVAVGHEYIHRVALHAEAAPLQVDVVAHVERIHQPSQKLVAVERLSLLEFDHALLHGHGASHAVDT